MQFPAALPLPIRRLRRRIIAINGDVIFAPLSETHTFAALEIYSWKNNHRI
jgi:hypothetical protein